MAKIILAIEFLTLRQTASRRHAICRSVWNSGRLSAPLRFTYEVDQIRIDRSPISLPAEGILKLRNFLHAAVDFSPLKNARRSALIWSALVVGIPCGKPGYTFSVAFFTIFADIRPAAPIGTI